MSINKISDTVSEIIKKAHSLGASLAGITDTLRLKTSPSRVAAGTGRLIPLETQSVLVLALAHDRSQPELDWWDGTPENTPGNRQLRRIVNQLRPWLEETFGIATLRVPYQIHDGGIYLKDAAVLAGLGILGKNNLVITPQFGPRVRLRALFLNARLDPTGPIDYNPCDGCPMPCRSACPQNAFAGNAFSQSACNIQMTIDESRPVTIPDVPVPRTAVRYCRACEWACPVGQ